MQDVIKDLRNATVVITGASSGIGHATALEFARKGSRLVLAARRKDVLKDVAEESRKAGAREVLVVATDVTDEHAVKKLADKAVDAYGTIDVWVNNAAVTLFGRFEDTPTEAYRQVIETNLFGYIHGVRAVMPQFRSQGSGTLINVSSVVASAPQPYTSAYVTSKYAINGLAECLRMELSLDKTPGIQICSVMPASIDTPLYKNAANYTNRSIKPLNPVYSPKKVARAIVGNAMYPRRKTVVGAAGKGMSIQHSLTPSLYERFGASFIDRGHFKREFAEKTPGNLFGSLDYIGMTGNFRKNQIKPYQLNAVLGAFVATGVGLAWLLSRKIHHHRT